MESKGKKFNNKVLKSVKAKKDFKPGELLTSKKRPSQNLVAILGLI